MRDLLTTLVEWQDESSALALATVVATSRSAPRAPGAALAVHPDGRVIGSVSGGCVEGAVVEVATEVLATGAPRRVRYGISDADAFAVGLTCGGTVDILVRRIAPGFRLGRLRDLVQRDIPVAVATVCAHADRPDVVGADLVVTAEGAVGEVGSAPLARALAAAARAAIGSGTTGLRRLGGAGEELGLDVEVFIQSFVPRPRMIVVGAADHADALVRVGRLIGFHVTVCDARERFATPERFPDADRVVVGWPHRIIASEPLDDRSAVCVLTHDPKFDVPALRAALAGPAGYIGVMGSRRTHSDRLERLRAAGIAEDQLERLRSPIGLDLGGRTPEEVAVSVAAEIVQLRHGGTGRPLRDLDGPVHGPSREVRTA